MGLSLETPSGALKQTFSPPPGVLAGPRGRTDNNQEDSPPAIAVYSRLGKLGCCLPPRRLELDKHPLARIKGLLKLVARRRPASSDLGTSDVGPAGKTSDVGPASKTSDVGPASKTSDVGPAGKTSDVGPAGKTSDVGPASKTSDVGPAGKTSDVGPAGKTSDVGPASKTSDVGPAGKTSDVGPAGKTSDVGPL
ncbi:hypothetical protein ACOMHN_031568 [Nucella lapillus]